MTCGRIDIVAVFASAAFGWGAAGVAATDPWQLAQDNARQSQEAIQFCRKYVTGWSSFADPASGLLPRTVTKPEMRFWNARDCAADNYPFLMLAGEILDDYHTKLSARHILEQERKLTRRVDSLPDDFMFDTQGFRDGPPEIKGVIFGAAEYCKDGLIPITEWLGPSPWSQRMDEMLRDIWKHAAVDSPLGKVPTDVIEVDGDLLQAMSRMYWMTGDERYKRWTFKIADLYLFHKRLLDNASISLRDHGCEIIGGLSEAYVLAAYEDLDRHARYRPELYALLDWITEHGLDEEGMMHIAVNTKTFEPTKPGFSDGWGYVFDAFLTVAEVDDVEKYRSVVMRSLLNISRLVLEETEGVRSSADQRADTLEGAINLLNRIPIGSTFDWVDREMAELFRKQKADGIIEGWYGDGNSARTALMYALMKTQGIAPTSWRGDVRIGAHRDCDGVVRVFMKTEYPWRGRLRFDRARHRELLNMPLDYARINQWPEWFTVEADGRYQVIRDGGDANLLTGKQLFEREIALEANQPALITITPLDGGQPAEEAAPRTQPSPGQNDDIMTPDASAPPAADAPHVVSPAGERHAAAMATATATALATATATAPATAPAKEAMAMLSPSTAPAPADDKPLRTMRYTRRPKDEAVAWQRDLRMRLFKLMNMTDLLAANIPLGPKLLGSWPREGYSLREVEFFSTPRRRIRAAVTVPTSTDGRQRFPAVVCIHGHGGDRRIVYEADTPYKGFAATLAASGYVTISIDVGQHEVYEKGRTLMGERLWDLIRCVDLLEILPEVDPKRIGCAGLSLGGEMAMWLGAMDPRIAATVSSGFLTRMDQMERGHCMCWKLDGLRELVDFADIYSLIAPRPLQCQNGRAEEPHMFTVPLAVEAMAEIKRIYADFNVPGLAGLAVHPGGHEVHVPSMLAFFNAHLKDKSPSKSYR